MPSKIIPRACFVLYNVPMLDQIYFGFVGIGDLQDLFCKAQFLAHLLNQLADK